MTLGELSGRLQGVRWRGDESFMARCPGHEDGHSSLSVGRGQNGGLVIKCFTGCSSEEIVRALGLALSDLMPPRADEKETVANQRETVYKFYLPNGSVLEHVRVETSGGKRFIWRRDGESGLGDIKVATVPLYNPEPSRSQAIATVHEGEKAAIAGARLGLSAYGTACGASCCPTAEVLEVLRGRDVVLWPDADDPGSAHMRKISAALKGIARSCAWLAWGQERGDDAHDFLTRGGTADQAAEMARNAERLWGPPKLKTIADGIKPALAQLDRYTLHDWSDRVGTSIRQLDERMLGGLRPGRVVLLGAVTGAGKTLFAQQLATHCARHCGPVLFVSPEMSVEELAERHIIRESGVAMAERAPWQRDADQKERAVGAHSRAASAALSESLQLHVLDDAATMDDVESAAAMIAGLRLIVIDYAQEVADSSDQRQARYLAVGDVARRGVRLAQKLRVPVLIASQVNGIKGKNGDVIDYEFRETRVLEQKASAVLLLIVKTDEALGRVIYNARLVCRKHRGGPIFSMDLDYEPKLFRVAAKEDAAERRWNGSLEDVVL